MKKNYLFFALLLTLLGRVHAQNVEVSGNQSGIWEDTIYIVGDVLVPESEMLTIEPGTVVIAKKNFKIVVNGGIKAEGDEENPIVFTVSDTTEFADYQTIRGGWGGIEIVKCSNASFKYCDFSYGKTAVGGSGAGLHFIKVNGATVGNCVFHDNIFRSRGGGICAEHSTIKVTDCEAYNNKGFGAEGSYTYGGGFFFINCDVEVENMISHDNYVPAGYGGGCSFDSCNVQLKNAIFYNNFATNAGGLGLQRSSHLEVKMSNVLSYNNEVIHYGGGMAMSTSSPEINNFTLVDNVCGGGGGAGLQMAFNSNPQINNTIIYGNHARYIDGEYYYGSQVWLWGADNFPIFNNGNIQYGLDTIYHNDSYTEKYYLNMIDEDPLFVDPQAHDYRLTNGSPCIDKGLEDLNGLAIPETDLNGQQRVFNNRIDMGCYEWNNIGLQEISSHVFEMNVVPNPLNFNSVCVVNIEKEQNAILRVVSIDGKEIFRKECINLQAGENVISLEGITENLEKNNRIYLIIIDTQCNRYYNKVVY